MTGQTDPTFSIHVTTLDATPQTLLAENPDLVLPTASAAKILVLLATARAIEHGTLDPDEPLNRATVAPVSDSGIWHRLRTGTLPVDDAARLVGTVSDNLATNVLIARLGGIRSIESAARDYGIHAVALHDIVRDERRPETGPEQAPTLSTGSAAGYTDLLRRLARAVGIEPAVAARTLDWLADGTDLSMVAGAFGLDPLAHRSPDRGIHLVNKTGTDAGVRADVGICRVGERGVAYACVARWQPMTDADPLRDQVLTRMRGVGEEIRAILTR